MSGSNTHLNKDFYRFDQMIGTGGIGTGMFFLMEGNHTLGRNESRAAKLVPFKDYCKLHIISHYVSVLLGSAQNNFKVWPIGKVGEDEQGRRLLEEMRKAGIKTSYVHVSPSESTMLSICYQYPDSTGGNITTSNSACEQVLPPDIRNAFNSIIKDSGSRTVVLAAPEVPVASRIELLREGKNVGAFNAASLLASEVKEFEQLGGFQITDYLSVNIDEAKAIAGILEESIDSRTIVNKCIEKMLSQNAGIFISVTDGPHGSYGYYDGNLEFVPPLRVEAVGTGGAGDAFLAGTLAGIICGLPLLKKIEDRAFGETPLESALELGTLIASLSVTSQDTIHQSLDAELVMKHALDHRIVFSDIFETIFLQTKM